jgi:hypothetical protein
MATDAARYSTLPQAGQQSRSDACLRDGGAKSERGLILMSLIYLKSRPFPQPCASAG